MPFRSKTTTPVSRQLSEDQRMTGAPPHRRFPVSDWTAYEGPTQKAGGGHEGHSFPGAASPETAYRVRSLCICCSLDTGSIPVTSTMFPPD